MTTTKPFWSEPQVRDQRALFDNFMVLLMLISVEILNHADR